MALGPLIVKKQLYFPSIFSRPRRYHCNSFRVSVETLWFSNCTKFERNSWLFSSGPPHWHGYCYYRMSQGYGNPRAQINLVKPCQNSDVLLVYLFGVVSRTNKPPKNKATDWLGALVRVTNLKFWFLRLRDKMLVFAGVVKKCLQHGHSFRLAGVWLKSENARWPDFALQGPKKNIRNLWFRSSESYQAGMHSSSFFLFWTLQCQSACGNAEATDCNKAALWRHVRL